MKTAALLDRAWRLDAADRLETASGVLGALLVTRGVYTEHIARVTDGAGALMGLSRAVRADSLEPWPATSLAEIAIRVRLSLDDLCVVARSAGLTSPVAAEDLSLVLGELEALLQEVVELLRRADKPAGALPTMALGTSCGRGVA
jgi:hypothetical protein